MGWVFRKDAMRTLERVAPWADLSLLREAIINRCRELVDVGGLLEDDEESLEKFVSGEKPTLPANYTFKNMINRITHKHAQGIGHDTQYAAACSWLRRYFLELGYEDWYRAETSEP